MVDLNVCLHFLTRRPQNADVTRLVLEIAWNLRTNFCNPIVLGCQYAMPSFL